MRRRALVGGGIGAAVVLGDRGWRPAFLATLLVRRTGNPAAPAVYATVLAAAAVVAAVASRETAFGPLDAADQPEPDPAWPGG